MFLHEEFEIFNVSIEITTQSGTRTSTMSAPRMILEQQFLSLVQEAAGSPEPVKIEIKTNSPIFSSFDNSWHDRECGIEFVNHAYIRSYGETM